MANSKQSKPPKAKRLTPAQMRVGSAVVDVVPDLSKMASTYRIKMKAAPRIAAGQPDTGKGRIRRSRGKKRITR